MQDRDGCKRALLFLIFLGSFFYIGCGGSNSIPPPPAAPTSASAVPFEKSFDVDLSSSASVAPGATFTLSNQGSSPVVMPAVVLKGNPALNRSSILYPLQGLKNDEFAKATWQFVVAHTRHYCYAGTSADTNIYAAEPMSLLNGFGAMCCDQSALLLTWLWQGGGYPARQVFMPFHEVAEIYYEGAWHLFDADHQVYYLQLDNKTVASTADIIANPSLVARVADANGNDPAGYPAQFWADQYAATTPGYIDVDNRAQHIYVLQPGQSLSINNAMISSPFPGPDPEPAPPLVGTGSFDWSLDYSNPNWSSLAQDIGGVTTLGDGFLTNTDATGSLVYALSSPFPVISLQVSGLVDLAGPDAAITASFSTDDASWSPGFALAGSANVPAQASADLSSVAAGQYIYFVKLELTGATPETARIANVHIVSQVQDSLFVFPNLIPGQVNHLTYQDWSPSTAEHNVAISFEEQ